MTTQTAAFDTVRDQAKQICDPQARDALAAWLTDVLSGLDGFEAGLGLAAGDRGVAVAARVDSNVGCAYQMLAELLTDVRAGDWSESHAVAEQRRRYSEERDAHYRAVPAYVMTRSDLDTYAARMAVA